MSTWHKALAGTASLVVALSAFGLTTSASAATGDDAVSASVSVTGETGARVPGGFVGLSVEPFETWRYLGTPAVASVTSSLLQRLGDGGHGAPLRVGGNTTDEAWWAGDGQAAPRGNWVRLDASWLSTLKGFAAASDSNVLLGADLGNDDPVAAARWANAASAALGPRLTALELGNEPDGFPGHAYSKNAPTGTTVRPSGYSVTTFLQEWTRSAAAMRAAVPVTVSGPASNSPDWVAALGKADSTDSLSQHRYPLNACGKKPGQADYPTVDALLGDNASDGYVDRMATSLAAARERGNGLVVSEMNSVACGGQTGVADSFASALWVSDTAFRLLEKGAGAFFVHNNSGTPYSPIAVRTTGSGLTASLRPLAYGLEAFKDAAPAGARVLQVQVKGSSVKAHATRSADGTTRLLVVNKTATPGRLRLDLAGAAQANVSLLSAPSVTSTDGTTLTTARSPRTSAAGTVVDVPAHSALVITVPPITSVPSAGTVLAPSTTVSTSATLSPSVAPKVEIPTTTATGQAVSTTSSPSPATSLPECSVARARYADALKARADAQRQKNAAAVAWRKAHDAYYATPSAARHDTYVQATTAYNAAIGKLSAAQAAVKRAQPAVAAC